MARGRNLTPQQHVVRGAVNPPRPGLRASAQPTKDRDPHQKFLELAEGRLDRLLKQFVEVRNLADRDYYEFTQDEVSEILTFLRHQVDLTEESFNRRKVIHGFRFKSPRDDGDGDGESD